MPGFSHFVRAPLARGWRRLGGGLRLALPLVATVCVAALAALPAWAGELTQWRFDRDRNQLSFTTSEPVQPRAQFVPESGRLIIDLPGAGWRQPTAEQRVGGAIARVQVVAFGEDATRLIVHLSPGFTLDANQVRVRSGARNQWTVVLPPVRRTAGLPGNDTPREPWVPGALREALEGTGQYQGPRSVTVQDFETFEGGFVIRTAGGVPSVQVTRSRDRRQIFVDVLNARLPNNLRVDRLISQQGVSRIILDAVRSPAPRVRLVLVVGARSPDWQASPGDNGAIVVRPGGSVVVAPPPRPNPINIPDPDPTPPTVDPRPPRWPRPQPNPRPPTRPEPLENDPSIPLNRALVYIDAGHGGRDPGALGIGGLRESDLVLDISRQVAALLQQQGIRVAMARDRDFFVSLEGRTDQANRLRATVFVSIHANSAGLNRPDVSGVETYYHQSGATLARYIHSSILQSLPYMRNRGIRQARFYVLRNSRMPSVLVETGFVTGEQDAALMNDPNWRSQMAAAIARGIIAYLR